MELVYLWVEDYKNIQKQGFNFSSKFICDYKDGTLTIEDNPEHIPNFFGANINVTAIVGKNGSGKSNLLKVIRQIIYKTINNGSFLIFYDNVNRKYICIYTTTKINSNIELTQDNIIDRNIIFPLFDYSFTYDDSMNYFKKQSYTYPNKSNGFISLKEELITNQANIINNYNILKEKGQLDKFQIFFQPNKIKIIFFIDKLKPPKNEELKVKSKINYHKLIAEFNQNDSVSRALELIENIWSLLSDDNNYKENQENTLGSIESELGPLHWEDTISIEELLKNNQLDKIIKDEDKFYLFEFHINEFPNEYIRIILNIFPIGQFKLELIDEQGKRLSDLSFGEQQLLFILNQIYSLGIAPDLYNQIDPFDTIKEQVQQFYKINYIIFFDEIDIGLHPNWQKRIIQYIIDFLNSTDDEKYYHLIFTTHSPFLLSDIPKENIIFLNDKSSIKQTFGANIHSLLSDSFFMEDGLMGEFAKAKIDKAITLLNQDKLSEDDLKYCEQIISIIGEPIVKNQLQRMLDSKRLSKIDAINKKIQDMSYELDVLKQHQAKIVQDDLRDKGKKQYKQRLKDD